MTKTPSEILANLETPEECEQFGINVAAKYPELALQATRRAVQLRALGKGANSVIEREALEAVFAYETVLSNSRRKKVRATRTWQMIERHGIVGAMERAVNRADDAAGFKLLEKMGLTGLSFEEVVLRHPDSFSPAAVARCKERLLEYGHA